MSRILWIVALAGLTTALSTTPAAAQFPFPPERIFGYYDRDADGELDEEEMKRVRSPLRETLERSGRSSVGRNDFIRLMEEQRRDTDDDDDDRDSNESSQGRTGPKLRARVTLELPSTYSDGDRDGDGQIGLYEWIPWKSRAAIREFLALDRNRDGFLTPYELKLSEKANGDSTTAGTAAGTRAAATRTTNPARSAPAATVDRPRLDEQTERIAREAFKNMAGEDQRISEEEWQRSQATRNRFEEAGVQLKLPADLDTFLAAYPAEQTDAPGAGTPDATPPLTRDSGEGRFRGRSFSRGER